MIVLRVHSGTGNRFKSDKCEKKKLMFINFSFPEKKKKKDYK